MKLAPGPALYLVIDGSELLYVDAAKDVTASIRRHYNKPRAAPGYSPKDTKVSALSGPYEVARISRLFLVALYGARDIRLARI